MVDELTSLANYTSLPVEFGNVDIPGGVHRHCLRKSTIRQMASGRRGFRVLQATWSRAGPTPANISGSSAEISRSLRLQVKTPLRKLRVQTLLTQCWKGFILVVSRRGTGWGVISENCAILGQGFPIHFCQGLEFSRIPVPAKMAFAGNIKCRQSRRYLLCRSPDTYIGRTARSP